MTKFNTTGTNPISKISQQIINAVKAKINFANIQTYDDLTKLANSSVSIWGTDIKTDEQKANAYRQYSEKLLLEYYDLNKDGQVTTEEFAKKEEQSSLKAMQIQEQKINELVIKEIENNPEQLEFYDTNGDKKVSNEEYTNALSKMGLNTSTNVNETIAKRSVNLFAGNLDMNADGIISTQELAFFNENADACDGEIDGVITNAGESAMFSAITGQNANDSEINRVVNKYLLGETLTAEEQAILEKSKTTIRNNMRKAAGI